MTTDRVRRSLPNVPYLHVGYFELKAIKTLCGQEENISSVAQSCPTPCDPMDCSTPGFPVLHRLPEFAQTSVRWVSDAMQPSHPLPPASARSLAASFFFPNKLALHISWSKYWSFSLSISLSNDYWGLISFRMDCFYLGVQGALECFTFPHLA